ncbi:MAG: hypothetical protein CL920_11175 [Deltaproteobacteria bacterium]|nr:hypothetical protein [Deltaproteobacteria bacterium]|tara:strand:- start:17479 stop:19044 length:1566 start_codon:yes stop_codon:yes gene_type:complete
MKPLKLSISAKLFLGFVCLLVTFVSVDIWSVYQLRQIGVHIRMLNRYQRLTGLASQMEVLRLHKKPAWQQFLKEKPSKWKQELYQRLRFPNLILKLLKQHHLRLVRFSRHSQQDKVFLYKLKAHLQRLRELFQQYHLMLSSAFASRQTIAKQWPKRRTMLQSVDRRLGREIRLLVLQMDLRLTQSVLLAEREERSSVWGVILISIIAIILGLIILLLSSIPLRRIQTLVDMIQSIKEGDYAKKADIPPGDEIGTLAKEFNSMAQALHERDLRLAQKHTELEEAYEDLQKSSEKLLRSERLAAIGRLAAQITHEIRNPLNSISLNLELLEEDLLTLPDPEESLAALRTAMEKIDHLTLITNGYLQFASGKPPQLSPNNINRVLTDLFEFLRPEFESRRVTWKLDLFEQLPEVNVDQNQISQALLNLIRNGMEAASQHGEEGHMKVLTHIEQENVLIEIQDNGVGITPEDLEQIFDPFFSTKEEGTGLGLPLTQQIINAHGGQITCRSQPGEGTTFTLTFPSV